MAITSCDGEEDRVTRCHFSSFYLLVTSLPLDKFTDITYNISHKQTVSQ